MLTRQQKEEQVKLGIEELKKAESLILVDFNAIPTADLRNLRILLKEFNGKMKVIKKRLLKIIFQKQGVDLDPTKFESQVGAVFVPTDLYAVSAKIYKFIKDLAKSKKDLKVLSAFDLKNNKLVSVEEFMKIAKLPTREILLAQVAMMMTVPIKKLLIVLNSRKEKLEV